MLKSHPHPHGHCQAGERGAQPRLQGPLTLTLALGHRERARTLWSGDGALGIRFYFKGCQVHKDNKLVALADQRITTTRVYNVPMSWGQRTVVARSLALHSP